MFEIWQHIASGARYLVVVHAGVVSVAAGPLQPWEDSRETLETHGNQHHNPWALLDMRKTPQAYRRTYTTRADGQVIAVSDTPEAAN